jgi:hypothetical protein
MVPIFFIGLGVDVDAVAVLGAVVIDTFVEHVPPRRLPNGKTQVLSLRVLLSSPVCSSPRSMAFLGAIRLLPVVAIALHVYSRIADTVPRNYLQEDCDESYNPLVVQKCMSIV